MKYSVFISHTLYGSVQKPGARSPAVIVRLYLCYLPTHDESLLPDQKIVASNLKLQHQSDRFITLPSLCIVRDRQHFVHIWMLTLILPLSFLATALCKSSNMSSTESEGVYESGGRQAH